MRTPETSRRTLLWVVILAAITPTFFAFLEALLMRERLAAGLRLLAFSFLFVLAFVSESYKVLGEE